LGRIASHLNADGGLFDGFSWTSQRVAIHEGIPADPVFDELYRTKYARNPWGDRAIRKPVGVGFTDRALLDSASLERTEYYQEFLRPRDIGHALFACLAATAISSPERTCTAASSAALSSRPKWSNGKPCSLICNERPRYSCGPRDGIFLRARRSARSIGSRSAWFC
jgi:hypothetical protein